VFGTAGSTTKRRVGGRIQTPSATNRLSVIPQEKPWPPPQSGLWQSGKRPLLSSFSIDQVGISHSIISFTALLLLPINAMFDLVHLDLESAVPHPLRSLQRVGYATVGIEIHGIPPFAKNAKDGTPGDLLHFLPRTRNAPFPILRVGNAGGRL
jgi:hypothetical protein